MLHMKWDQQESEIPCQDDGAHRLDIAASIAISSRRKGWIVIGIDALPSRFESLTAIKLVGLTRAARWPT
jgi:hypothetical protein